MGVFFIRIHLQAIALIRALKCPLGLDNIFFGSTGGRSLNPNTHQKSIFCAFLPTAGSLALSICPVHPGAES